MFKEVKKLLNENKKYYLISMLLIVFLIIGLMKYIGGSLGGEYKWLFLPSDMFGVPEELQKEYNLEAVYQGEDTVQCGWDGQFYYYISNDLFGTKGFSENVDAPAYRWQRIGLPLLANIVSKILLQKSVSVPVYVFTNLLILFLALVIILKYLKEKGNSIFWILPWIFSAGVIITLRHGLPDGVADAFLIISFIMLLKERYMSYSIFMTLTCLTREGYVLIAFFIFLFGLLGKLEHMKVIHDRRFDIKKFFQLALPGIALIFWYIYIYIRFGFFPFEQAMGITQLFLVSWFKYFMLALEQHNTQEFIALLIYLFFIINGMLLAYIVGKKKKIYWTLIPYIFLLGSFGDTVMTHWSGYLKGISVLYLLVPFMYLELKNVYLVLNDDNGIIKINLTKVGKKCLIVCLILIAINSGYAIKHFSQNVLQIRYREEPVVAEVVEPLDNFNSKITVEDYSYKKYSEIPLEQVFTKKYAIAKLAIENKSNTIWSQAVQQNGIGRINVSYKWYKKTKEKVDWDNCVLEGERYGFKASVLPKETIKKDIYITYPSEPGNYILRIALLQEGVSWFYEHNMGYVDLEINIE
ncbi:hypothetical protein [Velocimicrobium porci]|uniref:Glycosyltransferase RgtA/B/C/D-like domain-containing protein n=1 Tax=Velocimicrobium porci TaxID=2606634 RepID=A0A6L5Y305_9FIRM|nr:hypothetical protein [Velocimicrobium porci]MSS64503.1 hypothetical protein [Velocimicrobium porci]